MRRGEDYRPEQRWAGADCVVQYARGEVVMQAHELVIGEAVGTGRRSCSPHYRQR